MPKVGKRSFAYTQEGKMAAKKYAKKSGKPMRTKVSNQIIPGGGGGKGG